MQHWRDILHKSIKIVTLLQKTIFGQTVVSGVIEPFKLVPAISHLLSLSRMRVACFGLFFPLFRRRGLCDRIKLMIHCYFAHAGRIEWPHHFRTLTAHGQCNVFASFHYFGKFHFQIWLWQRCSLIACRKRWPRFIAFKFEFYGPIFVVFLRNGNTVFASSSLSPICFLQNGERHLCAVRKQKLHTTRSLSVNRNEFVSMGKLKMNAKTRAHCAWSAERRDASCEFLNAHHHYYGIMSVR